MRRRIIELIIIILIFAGSTYGMYYFINMIEGEKLDTTYMWNIKEENIKVIEGSQKGELKETDKGIELSVTLLKPKQFYEVQYEIVNKGTLDAYVSKINNIVQSTDNILTCKTTYLDGKKIVKGDKLKSGEKKTIKIRIEYPEQKEKIYKKLKLLLRFSMEFKADS